MVNGTQYCIYGDQTYVIRPWIQTALPTALATEEQVSFNTFMNEVRIAVEWNCKDVKQEFDSRYFHRKLQVRQLPAGSL